MTDTIFDVNLHGWDDVRQFARPIREAVFVVEQGVPVELEWDEWDALSVHALALSQEGAPIGTGRLLPADSGGGARLGRMAVLPAWRGRGAGRAILAMLLNEARRRGVRRIDIHAQMHATPFYRREGFVQTGTLFEEAGIPHLAMFKTL